MSLVCEIARLARLVCVCTLLSMLKGVHSLLAKQMHRIQGIPSLSEVSVLGVADYWSGENSEIAKFLEYLWTLMSPAFPVCTIWLTSCNRSKANL